jgi:small neutral amino acid transporter SnatA (MarC family)
MASAEARIEASRARVDSAHSGHVLGVKETTVTAAGVIDTFLLLLIGVGPKIALVPFLKITAPLDPETQTKVRRKMLLTAGVTALVLVVLGELLRRLLHFSVGSLSVAGGVILLVAAVQMILKESDTEDVSLKEADPMRLAVVPLAVPLLLNPVGIVGLVTISSEAGSLVVLLVEIAILLFVLLIDAVTFKWADRAAANLQEDRMLVVEKVFGFLIGAIGVQLILDGLHTTGVIAHLTH